MKILVVSTNGLLHDGITAWMTQYFGAMDKSDLDVHSVAWEGTDLELIREAENVGITLHFTPSRKKDTLAYIAELSSVLNEGFDILHVCGNSATMAIELLVAKARVVDMRVAHVHNTVCSHRIVDKLLRPVFYRCATDYFACGTDAGRWMYGERPFQVIPNGKDPRTYTFDPEKRKLIRVALGLRKGQTAIGHVGSFNDQKNHKFLLRVFGAIRASDPDARLFLIGDGENREDVCLRAEVAGLSSSVTFLGQRSDVPDLLQAMDCMVLPSLFEGFPNVVLEWQLAGLPSVISDRVTEECAVTSLVSRLSLDEPPETWAEVVETKLLQSDRELDCVAAARLLTAAGYDIRENASMLRRLYYEGAKKIGA